MRPARMPTLHCSIPVSALIGIAAVSLTVRATHAQQPAGPVFEAETALMEIEVRVTGRGGRPVPDLRREDFELSENGRLQEIATFEFVPPPSPLAVPDQPVAPDEPTPADAAGGQAELRRSTFIYIAARGRRQDRIRIHRAVKDFIDESVRPGLLVSIEGSPFTSDKGELYSLADSMLRARTGPNFVDTLAVDLARENQPSVWTEAALAELEDLNDDFQDGLEEIADRAALYRRLRMYEYIDLIRALSVFPGRKMVVLFMTGLPVDEDNVDVMKALEDEATRARVRFFVSDVSGLSATAPGGDAEAVLPPSAIGQGLAGVLFDAPAAGRQNDQDGVWELAQVTGGRAVLNSNDFGEVFDVVERESWGYYLIGYYPEDREQRGRLRRIKVRVSDGRLKVSHQRGYFEERQFTAMTRSEKNLHLHKALTSEAPHTDLPIVIDYEMFRDSTGKPTLVYCVGLRSSDLPSARRAKSEQIKLTVVAQAAARRDPSDRPRSPVIDERQFEMKVGADDMSRLRANSASWLHYGSQISLAPGVYDWRVVVRDDLSGSLGSYSAAIRIPANADGIAASTLMLTGRIEDTGQSGGRRPGNAAESVLVAKGSQFFPTAVKAFAKGASIFLLYDVYNLDAETLASPPGPALALYRGNQRVERIPVKAFQTVSEPEARRVRYLAALQSADLDPGDYTLAALLPQYRGDRRAIVRGFQIVDPAGDE